MSLWQHNRQKCLLLNNVLNCFTVLCWLQWDCSWGSRHGLQLSGITHLWLVGLNIDWDFIVPYCTMGSRDQWKFLPVTVPVHSPNGRHLPAVRAVQKDCHWGLKNGARGLWKSIVIGVAGHAIHYWRRTWKVGCIVFWHNSITQVSNTRITQWNWINYTHSFLWDVIAHTCQKNNGGKVEPTFKLGPRGVIS